MFAITETNVRLFDLTVNSPNGKLFELILSASSYHFFDPKNPKTDATASFGKSLGGLPGILVQAGPPRLIAVVRSKLRVIDELLKHDFSNSCTPRGTGWRCRPQRYGLHH
jgi:hypothetical protein